MATLTSGMIWSSTLPDWQRDYYSLLLLETLRTKSILVPYCAVKRDYEGGKSGVIIYTEVYDSEPNWNALTESSPWLTGSHLDSRTVQIALEIHGDVLKFSDYSEIVQYVNAGNIRGLVKNKIGQNQVDYLDILARNAFLAHPNKVYGDDATSRATIAQTDLFTTSLVESMRVHLEENEVPGVANPDADNVQTLVCTTTPRVVKDIRTAAGSDWISAQEYAGSVRLFNGEMGMWNGIRFAKTQRLKLWNHGAASVQTTLNGATSVGQGAYSTVDTVYTPGQTGSTRYVTLTDETGLAVGDYVTISAQASGVVVLEGDGSQETRRIVNIDAGNNRVSFDKPLMKAHANGDYVTRAVDVHASVLHGGPSVVYGIGEAPHPVFPPTYDDLMIIQRLGWRGFLKFQMFRPEFFQVAETGASTD